MDHDLELRHLRYFVAVAEELHFGRAAERLHLSQPPLSQQIRKLEEILGYELFTRTSRSVALTAAGHAFLERAHRTLRNVQRDIDETRGIGRGEVGSLNIGFVGSAMLTTLPGIFRAYRAANPQVQLRLAESFTARVAEGLDNGSLDAGILRDSDQAATPGTNLTVRTLYSEPFLAILPANHPCARQRSISPGVLRGEPFVFYPRSAGARAFDKPMSLFDPYGFRPQVVQEASHWLTILSLIGTGFGVSIAPACVRRIGPPAGGGRPPARPPPPPPDVVCLPLRHAPHTTPLRSSIELAWRTGDTRPIVQRFAHIASSTGPQLPRRLVER
jgi:DNA-binding transcriptional LysR family regulator